MYQVYDEWRYLMSGAQKLRELREERNRRFPRAASMEVIAVDAEISFRALHKIETGVTKEPNRETIVRILNALHKVYPISLREYNDVLNKFGFVGAFLLPLPPTDEEIAWARQRLHADEYNVYPAYLVTIEQELRDWNRFAPRIVGLKYGTPEMDAFRGITIFDLALNPTYRAALNIENHEEFIPHMIYVIKRELVPLRNELWYHNLVEKAKLKYTRFKEVWESIPDEGLEPVGQRAMGPMHIRTPDGTLLKFRLLGSDFADDLRFRLVQYTPIDDVTEQQCRLWAEEERE